MDLVDEIIIEMADMTIQEMIEYHRQVKAAIKSWQYEQTPEV